jgi:hypothetical protein
MLSTVYKNDERPFRTIPYKATFSRAANIHPGNGIRRSNSPTIFRTLTKIGDIGQRVALSVRCAVLGGEQERKRKGLSSHKTIRDLVSVLVSNTAKDPGVSSALLLCAYSTNSDTGKGAGSWLFAADATILDRQRAKRRDNASRQTTGKELGNGR